MLLGQKQYSLGVDTWSVGCIFHELVEKKTLFVGDCEIDQIFKIFQVHGTPNNDLWPGVSQLPDFKPTFPQFKVRFLQKPKDFALTFKNFDPLGLDLFKSLIALDPARRISMKEALQHPYFKDLVY